MERDRCKSAEQKGPFLRAFYTGLLGRDQLLSLFLTVLNCVVGAEKGVSP
jgi:hypothetical protein